MESISRVFDEVEMSKMNLSENDIGSKDEIENILVGKNSNGNFKKQSLEPLYPS